MKTSNMSGIIWTAIGENFQSLASAFQLWNFTTSKTLSPLSSALNSVILQTQVI